MSNIRKNSTGNYRFRLKSRWFRDPCIVLQQEFKFLKYTSSYGGNYYWKEIKTLWVDVTVEDLTTMDLDKLINPVGHHELPICFKPHSKLFGWCLVLQVCEGAYELNQWRPARLQDLVLKDGKIQGGLGLMAR